MSRAAASETRSIPTQVLDQDLTVGSVTHDVNIQTQSYTFMESMWLNLHCWCGWQETQQHPAITTNPSHHHKPQPHNAHPVDDIGCCERPDGVAHCTGQCLPEVVAVLDALHQCHKGVDALALWGCNSGNARHMRRSEVTAQTSTHESEMSDRRVEMTWPPVGFTTGGFVSEGWIQQTQAKHLQSYRKQRCPVTGGLAKVTTPVRGGWVHGVQHNQSMNLVPEGNSCPGHVSQGPRAHPCVVGGNCCQVHRFLLACDLVHTDVYVAGVCSFHEVYNCLIEHIHKPRHGRVSICVKHTPGKECPPSLR